MEGIVEESVSGSCTECSECLVISKNKKRTKLSQKCIKNKGKMKPKHSGKCSVRNCGKLQEAMCNKHDSMKLIKAPESIVVAEQESINVATSCNCPCIKSYIKFLDTLEMCNCSRKKQNFKKTFANKDDSIESEKQGFSDIKEEPSLKHWKGPLKIITSSISLPFNLLKIRTNKKKKFLKTKPKYQKIINEQQYIYGNGNIPTMNKNMGINKLAAGEIYDDKFTSQNDIRTHQNKSSISMDRIFHICKRNSIQGLREDFDEIESAANKQTFKDCKETRSSIIQEMNAKSSENFAGTKIQQRNEFHQSHSEIFSNINKNDSLNTKNMQPIRNKKLVNVQCPLTELGEISRKEELQSKFRGNLRHNIIRKFNSLGSSQRRYIMGNRNNSNHNMKECIDKLLADMEYKSGSCMRLHKGLSGNTEDSNLQKSDECIDGRDIPKEISKLKQLLKDKILLHRQESETSVYTLGTSCKINTPIKSDKVKFSEIIKSYSDIMNDLETLCENQDSIHNNQSSIKNLSEHFIHVNNSENKCIEPLFNDKNEKVPKSLSKSKSKSYNEHIIEPVVEKTDSDDMIHCKQNFIQKNMNISDKEEILTLDSGDSVQETKISKFKSDRIETISDAKNTEFTKQSTVYKKPTRSKRRATKAWQENQFTESDTTQSPIT